MSARKYLVGLATLALLIWGPIKSSWPAPLLIRVLYLITIPTLLWFALAKLWKVWRPDALAEDRLHRTLAGVAAGALLLGAIFAARASHHFDCTEKVVTRDGYECVGDYVRVQGPDFGQTFLLTLASGFAFWLGLRGVQSSDLNDRG
ncbi:MAG TPA: hypothetical protein VGQ21_14145 [Thermoanaerobaculia bacterium]|jgi:hypothetical protein|nr:hypothetical protein [Thermoanaerobaculia bacterium]